LDEIDDDLVVDADGFPPCCCCCLCRWSNSFWALRETIRSAPCWATAAVAAADAMV